MKPAPFPKPQPKPLILTNRDEDLLIEIYKYRFTTTQEITHLLFSKGSRTYVRSRLSKLSGNKDHAEGYPLYRFALPTAKTGNRERIYTLGRLGRDILESLGLPVDWAFKFAKLRTFSHSHLLHSLTLSRTVAAFHAWARTKPTISLESRLSYELAKNPAVVSIPQQGKILKVSVVPDTLVLVENIRSGQRLVILWEIDHNTESQPRFKQHIAARLAYVQSSHFTNIYGNIPYRIAYATQGITDSAAKARLASMCAWTMNVLTQLKKQEYSRFLCFTTVNFSTLYEDAPAIFEAPRWYRPDDPATAVPLLTD